MKKLNISENDRLCVKAARDKKEKTNTESMGLELNNGKIIAEGSHEELLKTNKAYANEARLQELEAEVGEKRER